MLYAILCYSDEAVTAAKTRQQDDALMRDLDVVHGQLIAEGKLGPHLRLVPTAGATTLRHSDRTTVLDGPFAETKEALLGFYIVECESREEAVEIAQRLAGPRMAHGFSPGALEIRPVSLARQMGGKA